MGDIELKPENIEQLQALLLFMVDATKEENPEERTRRLLKGEARLNEFMRANGRGLVQLLCSFLQHQLAFASSPVLTGTIQHPDELKKEQSNAPDNP